jgi:hypothetical protein
VSAMAGLPSRIAEVGWLCRCRASAQRPTVESTNTQCTRRHRDARAMTTLTASLLDFAAAAPPGVRAVAGPRRPPVLPRRPGPPVARGCKRP